MRTTHKIAAASLLLFNNRNSTPTVSVAPSANASQTIGVDPGYVAGEWSSGTPVFDRWESSADGSTWAAAAAMPDADSPPTDAEFGKVLRVIEVNGSTEAASAATGAVEHSYESLLESYVTSTALRLWHRYRETSGSTAANSGSTGSALNGTVGGTVTFGQTGHLGANEAALFDGLTGVISVANNAAIAALTAYTIAALVYATSAGENDIGTIILWDGTTTTLRINAAALGVRFVVDAGTDGVAATNVAFLPLNTWVWIFATYDDAGDRKPYIYKCVPGGTVTAATYATQTASAGSIAALAGSLHIGNNGSGGVRTWAGSKDEVLYFNGVLTTAEMQAIADTSAA
jgi:hypothetical protein